MISRTLKGRKGLTLIELLRRPADFFRMAEFFHSKPPGYAIHTASLLSLAVRVCSMGRL